MTSLALPPLIANAPVGAIVLEPSEHTLNVYMRVQAETAAEFPNPCPVQLHLAAWEQYPPAVPVALVLRLARKDRFIFMQWIDMRRPDGAQALQNLATDSRLFINVVSSQIDQTIRVANSVKRDAARMMRFLEDPTRTWTAAEFAAATQQAQAGFQTSARLWRICEKALQA